MSTTAHDGVSREDLAGVQWHISSRSTSGGGGDCVEAGPLGDGTGRVAVRHSKHPDGPCVIYTRTEWVAFVAGIKDGEFNFDTD
ncbi:MAG: DUF397 domain-containing protein [Micromonosporaceae bacterium]|nr:DUF397 domain-containing protein [Micromonosporaceae bacterium]